jgi:uncharacterized phage-like protein YoqJ
MIVAGTGHRPDKLGGYLGFIDKVYPRLVDLAAAALKKFSATKVISGMAQGWDWAIADAAIRLQLPWEAALPCDGQDAVWPVDAKQYYASLLSKATTVTMCGPGGGYAVWKMNYRNKYMVDWCDLLLALWNGTKGGTNNCVSYAQEKERRMVNVWPSWEKFR